MKAHRGFGGNDSNARGVGSDTLFWRLAAMAVVCAGLSGSLLIARSRAHAEETAAGVLTARRLADIGSSTKLALQRELDLTVAARPFFSDDPGTTDNDVERWAATIGLHENFPEVLGIGIVRFVRPFSCYATATAGFDRRIESLPTGTDLCALGLGGAVLEARDSGQSSVVASTALFGEAQIMIQAPLYRGGIVPATVAVRRATFVGNVGVLVDPGHVLAAARDQYPALPVALTFRDSEGHQFSFATDPPVSDRFRLTSDLGNGWSVSTTDIGAQSSPNATAFGLTVGIGLLISVLLALLVYTLATGRLRAVRTVELRTAELRRLAMHDSLTDLPNRTLILQQIDNVVLRCLERRTVPAVLYIDLDGFKSVNDTFGHLVGDQLLLAVADRLCGVFRKPDSVGRMGGDEFVAVLETENTKDAETVAGRVLNTMREAIRLDVDGEERAVYVTASVGIATGSRATSSELLRDADLALYRAKAHGSDCYRTFRPEMHQTALETFEIDADLHDACVRQAFELDYQPIYNLDDLSLVGVEALLRWNHPGIGNVPPDKFIPFLERNGQIVTVGRWVLNQACRQTASWRSQGHDLTLAVNVSGRQLDREGIVSDIRTALDASGLDADALTIEITETALVRDATATAERLAAIKRLGVHISIDDFGTGYCSLAYLQRFAVDGIKIDRSFTQAIDTTSESNALVRTLVQLANDLGVYTLAEGVETLEQLDQLRALHVDHAQGYLLSRPLNVATIQSNILNPITRAHRKGV